MDYFGISLRNAFLYSTNNRYKYQVLIAMMRICTHVFCWRCTWYYYRYCCDPCGITLPGYNYFVWVHFLFFSSVFLCLGRERFSSRFFFVFERRPPCRPISAGKLGVRRRTLRHAHGMLAVNTRSIPSVARSTRAHMSRTVSIQLHVAAGHTLTAAFTYYSN